MLSLFCPEGVSIFNLCQPLSCTSKRAIDKKKCLQFTLPTILSDHNPPTHIHAHTNSAPKLLRCR